MHSEQITNAPSSIDDLRSGLENGQRKFLNAALAGLDLRCLDLRGISLIQADLRSANLEGMDLTHTQLKAANLSGATLRGSQLVACDLIWASFDHADLTHSDFTGSAVQSASLLGCDLSHANLNNIKLHRSDLRGAKLTRTRLNSADLCDLDLSPLCDARSLRHVSPSFVDARAVMKSHRHRDLKSFMMSCGVPSIFCDYMIECAVAIDGPLLRRMMQSTFISYGGPDESFAEQLSKALRMHGVTTFFFPDSALIGERIDVEVYRAIDRNDRIVLICSRASLDRPGVLHEIREALDRESREGGLSLLIPVLLDDYLISEWHLREPQLAKRLNRRVAADFRGTRRSTKRFNVALERLLSALRRPQD